MLPQIMESFLLNLEGEKRSEKTIRSYRKNLISFLDGMFDGVEPSSDEYGKLNTEDFMRWVGNLMEINGLSASTVNQRVATLRKFYTYLVGMRVVSVNVPQTLGVIKSESMYQRTILDEYEVKELVKTCKRERMKTNSYNSYRDELIVNLFLVTGLRIDELHNISVSDINMKTGEFQVIGKRNKKRTVFIPKSKLPMIQDYLVKRGRQSGKNDKSLFLSRQSGAEGYRLSTDQIRRIVIKLAKLAGVTSITPHSLRHTGATLQIKKGADIMDVSKWLGHSTVAITEKIYVHQTNESAQRVANIFDDII